MITANLLFHISWQNVSRLLFVKCQNYMISKIVKCVTVRRLYICIASTDIKSHDSCWEKKFYWLKMSICAYTKSVYLNSKLIKRAFELINILHHNFFRKFARIYRNCVYIFKTLPTLKELKGIKIPNIKWW